MEGQSFSTEPDFAPAAERRNMAIYHCSIKIGSRHGTKSSVAAVAYRAGERLKDERTGKVYDYTRKKEVVYSEIMCPDQAPSFFYDRSCLWNSVEQAEKQDNAQLYREFELALPRELSTEHQILAARKFFRKRVEEGMIVDWSFHDKKGNPHVHGISPTRALKADGSWAPKRKQVYVLDENGDRVPVIDPKTGQQKIGAKGRKMWKRETVESNGWNDTGNAERWREEWAEICNHYLALEKKEERVDHRSYERQGIEQVPTRHEGYAARMIEERGGISEIREANRLIRKINDLLRSAKEAGIELIERFYKLREKLRRSVDRAYGQEDSIGDPGSSDRDDRGHERTAGSPAESRAGSGRPGEQISGMQKGEGFSAGTDQAGQDGKQQTGLAEQGTHGHEPKTDGGVPDEVLTAMREGDRITKQFREFLKEREQRREQEIAEQELEEDGPCL